MSHDRHTESSYNSDCLVDAIDCGVPLYLTRGSARDYYLELLEDFKSAYPDPVVVEHDGVRVVREDLIVGTKARAAEAYVSRSNAERFVYCQPRTGLAGVALIDVARRLNRRVTLFMPASKRISEHQAACIERGADPVFERIAAMPNLNKYAKEWAEDNGADFIPLGLRHELATAAIVRAASSIPEPEVFYCAVSTGVLIRALQIAWPNARAVGVAVARNLKDGEKGDARIYSETLEFQRPEHPDNLPDFPTVPTYDGKCWKYVTLYKDRNPNEDVLFWNVGTDPVVQDKSIYDRVVSNVPWRKDR